MSVFIHGSAVSIFFSHWFILWSSVNKAQAVPPHIKTVNEMVKIMCYSCLNRSFLSGCILPARKFGKIISN